MEQLVLFEAAGALEKIGLSPKLNYHIQVKLVQIHEFFRIFCYHHGILNFSIGTNKILKIFVVYSKYLVIFNKSDVEI